MSYTKVLQIRVPADQYERYEAAAAAAGLSMSSWLRDQLEASTRVSHELLELRKLLMRQHRRESTEAKSASVSAPQSSAVDAVQLEMLLLLRAVSGQHLRVVHGELQRQGMQPFDVTVGAAK